MELLGEGDAPVLGPYRLVAELGRGGMGRVMLGVTPDGRLAAVKVVRSQFVEDEGFRTRFRREVEASRRVSGAYTAAVVDADADAPLPWLASVFVPGPPLSEVVENTGPLPTKAAARLAAGLAAALAEIHRAGLIHRDLKPSNVLLAQDGPRVIDFGIARATDGQGGTEITHTGWLVGSPAFMSPEQAEGRELTPASDVFSLGTVLVHACTGQSPFAGSAAPQTLYNVVHTEPDLASLPDDLRGLVAQCLAKNPSQRPTPAGILQSLGPIAPSPRPWPAAVHALIDTQHAEILRAVDLPEDGGALLESETATAARTEPSADGAPRLSGEEAPVSQDPGPPPPGAGLADLPTQTAVPPTGGGPSADQVPPAGASTAEASDKVPEDPARLGRPSRRALLLGALGAGVAAAVAVPLTWDRRSGPSDPGASGASPSRNTSPSATPSTTRSTSPSPERTSRFIVSSKSDTRLSAAEFSRDGRFIAVGDWEGGVVLRHSSTLETAAVLSEPETHFDNPTGDLTFSPDGSLLASVDDYATITLWDVASRKKAATLHGDKSQKSTTVAYCLTFSQDGRTLAFSANRTIAVWDVKSHDKIATLIDSPDDDAEYIAEDHIASVAFTQDARTIVSCNDLGKLRFWDIRQRRVIATVQGRKEGLLDLVASPDGKVLAAAALGEVTLWRSDSRKEIEVLPLSSKWGSALAFSPDGRFLAAADQDGAAKVWSTATWNPTQTLDKWIEEATDSLQEALSDTTPPNSLSFSPGGELLAESMSDYLIVWKLG
ncbi:protein kinase domain-containing protein [Streptomyces tanashiensis]|uniref:protein kinase domain-containing protein n=1 Tax=Streptomyces tanashiensis TaxID=67367 RepID=UPI0034234739